MPPKRTKATAMTGAGTVEIAAPSTLTATPQKTSFTFDEFADVAQLTIVPSTPDEKLIYDHVNESLSRFKPLVRYYIDFVTQNELIDEKALHMLWLFFSNGNMINAFMRHKQQSPLPSIDVTDARAELDADGASMHAILANPIRYQLLHQILYIDERLREYEQLKNVFATSSNPIDWFKANNNSYEINNLIDDKLRMLHNKLYDQMFNIKFNPLLQL